ncbi:hypothetical protein FF38_04295 [Lucilia cuprina]|uniref:Uncharacterized protein n=1 Tax=Lucilia cuprina TaxID=7375 RepID=A0A0L0CP56_LUCCU|nr:hypothetical protein FF38_04295 [Lucilia cuprina]
MMKFKWKIDSNRVLDYAVLCSIDKISLLTNIHILAQYLKKKILEKHKKNTITLRCQAALLLLLLQLLLLLVLPFCSQANRNCKAGCNNTNFQISVLILIRVKNSPCESATARIISNNSSRDRPDIFGKRATRAKSLTINFKACSLISKIFV